MNLRVLSTRDLEACLPMPLAVAAMKDAFLALARGDADVPERLHLDVGTKGTLLTMPAHAPGLGLITKLVTIYPGNRSETAPSIQGLVTTFDPETGTPTGLLDGAGLTAWRTGAASGAATDLLARPDARLAAVFGTGAQARTQVLALDAVRTLDEIRISSRDADRRRAFINAVAPDCTAPLRSVDDADKAVEGADIVATATDATAPLFSPERLAPGAHVNAVGSFRRSMRELEPRLVDAARVFVDQREAAASEAGELIERIEAGTMTPDDWTELGDVVSHPERGRRSDDELTLFKSVGSAVQDLFAASRAMARAATESRGTVWPWPL